MSDAKKIVETAMVLIKQGRLKEAEQYLLNMKKKLQNESVDGK